MEHVLVDLRDKSLVIVLRALTDSGEEIITDFIARVHPRDRIETEVNANVNPAYGILIGGLAEAELPGRMQ